MTKKDIAGGRIERIFLKDDIFYKKMENTRLNNEVYSYIHFQKHYPKLIEFIPKFYGVACLAKTEEYIDMRRKFSFVNCTQKSLKRLEVLNYSKVKRKKRKKLRYIDKIKSKNDQNRMLFDQYSNYHTSLSPKPLKTQKFLLTSLDENIKNSVKPEEDFIMKDLDIFKEFSEFPTFQEIWKFNSECNYKEDFSFQDSFPDKNDKIRQILIKSKIKKKILEVLQGKSKYYLALENLLKDDSFSVLDIKLNLVRQEKKFLMTDKNHRYNCPKNNQTMKIVGLIIKSASGKVLLNLTKGCSYFDYHIQKRFIRKLFEYEQDVLDLEALNYAIFFLERLKNVLMEYKLVPVSSSIVVFYSAKHKSYNLKLVDFANIPVKMKNESDILGLVVFIKCLKEIRKENERIQN
jgi:hypothetical protein